MAALAEMRDWLGAKALPLWRDNGQCPDTGAFYESLALDGTPNIEEPRRVRVQFRQIFAFSIAHLLGFGDGFLDVARRGLAYVRARAWAVDGRPGWAHVLHPDGAVADPMRDAYDHAFAMYALAWHYRATGDPAALALMRQTLAFVDAELTATNGGYRENDAMDLTNPSSLRRQNPHMHLFEAFLAQFDATQDRAYLLRAAEIFRLFDAHFFDADRRILREYFSADWTALDGARQRVEPGHMAEWTWLLREYHRLAHEPVGAYGDAMFAQLRAHGGAPGGRGLVDALDLDFNITARGRRLWPQTELFRAAMAQYERTGAEEALQVGRDTLSLLFDDYFSGCAPGGWLDKLGLDGETLEPRMPGSLFYHVIGVYAAGRAVLEEGGAKGEAPPIGPLLR